jgi:hypothetical protein
MNWLSGELAAAIFRRPGGTPAHAASAFNFAWPSWKPENNASAN